MTIRTEYKVPEYNLGKLKAKVEALNRKAERLGTSPITLTKTGIEDLDLKDAFGKKTGKVVRLVLLTLEGEAPQLAGWRFVATLQHEESGNIVRVIPGETLPEEYRINPQKCDHCRSDRFRKDTYIVANEDGEYAQVGSTCLKDFTGGNSPQRSAAYAEMIIELDEMFSDPFDYFEQPPTSGEYRWDLGLVITWTLAVVREYGWLPKSKADEHHRPTAGWVEDALIDRARFVHYNGFEPTEEDEEKSQEVISWGRDFLDNQNGLNDYQWNMSVTLETEAIPFRSLGLACSLVSMYWRETEKARIEAERRTSQHVGTVGKREHFSGLTLNKVIVTEGYYGTTKIHKFTDSEGNELVWFASNEWLDEGSTYEGKATVKAHDEYNGINQTVITRCSFEEAK